MRSELVASLKCLLTALTLDFSSFLTRVVLFCLRSEFWGTGFLHLHNCNTWVPIFLQLSNVCICKSYKIFIENIHFAKTTKVFDSQLFTILISYNIQSILNTNYTFKAIIYTYINFYMYVLRAKSAKHAVLSVQSRIKCRPFNSTMPDGHQYIHNYRKYRNLLLKKRL